MRTHYLLIGTVAIVLLAAPAAFAKTHAKAHAAPSPQQIFQTLYDQMNNAARHYNLDGAMADYSPHITFTDIGEPSYGFAEARRSTISFFHLERSIVSSTVITSVLPVGDGSYLVVATTRTTR